VVCPFGAVRVVTHPILDRPIPFQEGAFLMTDKTAPKFYVTKFEVTVLSQTPDLSGGSAQRTRRRQVEAREVNGAEMALLLRAQGSDPEFFGIDDEGNPVAY
jgi:hypothetical protein